MAYAIYVQPGISIDYKPTADVAAGDVVVQNDLVGIAVSPIPANTLGTLVVAGIFDVAKASATVFAAGAKVYWDAANRVAVASDAGGAKYMGKAVQAAPSGATKVRVRLSQ